MNSKSYLEWAQTKNLTAKQYNDLGLRLRSSIDQLQTLHAAMGVTGEAGELMDAVKKHVLYNQPLDEENIKEELGDLLWYMSLLVDRVDSSFEEIMAINYDKLEKRYPTGFSEKLAKERRDKK